MDPKLAFWTWALLDMGVMVAVAAFGIWRARSRAIPQHRRAMLISVGLLAVFLGSYVLKLGLLGREALETWRPVYVHVLRFHETCVAVMLLAGGTAVWLALRHRLDTGGGEAATRRTHRRAGWTAFAAAVLGVFSAGVVLFGMYQRASG